VPPFGALSAVALAAFVVTTLVVSAAVHVYHDASQRLGEQERPPEVRDR
jgi:divalent metal cation (Fe/Co/Zn/Cd) transporter